MYNFIISKRKKEEILENVIFNDEEKYIFEKLTLGIQRKELPNELNISERTIARRVKNISKKINEYEINKNNITHKIYIHKFPNGKKYVGVCQHCEDRWSNGNGYAYNEKMYKDIIKYGWDNIEHKILFETNNSELAYQLEKILIDELELVKNGYNQQ